MEWAAYAITGFLEKLFQTQFQLKKQGRKFAASCWGSLLDANDKWGYEFVIKTGAGTVRT